MYQLPAEREGELEVGSWAGGHGRLLRRPARLQSLEHEPRLRFPLGPFRVEGDYRKYV